MQQLVQQYMTEVQQAGFLVIPSEDAPLLLVDRDTFMHLVFKDSEADDEEQYYVSRWYKQTPAKTGDYSGCPDFEGSLVECLTYVRDWKPL